MIGHFWFYRRRRVLPFLAVYCLVFINTATLVPFASPAAPHEAAAASTDALAVGVQNASWRWVNDERGDAEPDSLVTGGLPPIVKNLRRHQPGRRPRVACWGGIRNPRDSRASRSRLWRRAPAAGTADLARLCRFLI